MTPQMMAALSSRRVLIAGLLRISLPGHVLRLCDGSAAINWGGETFRGRDPVFGTIGEVEALDEQIGDSIPGLDIMLMPPSTSAAVQLSAAAMQGAAVRLWLAVVNPETGSVLPSPELLFAGEVDTTELEIDRGERRLHMSIASVWERLFEPNEGATLSDAFHRSIWPQERGFEFATGVTIDRLWGPGDKPSAVTSVPSFPATGVQRYF